MLRVGQLRFERRDAEESGIEQRDVVEDAACRNVGRIGAKRDGDRRIELVGPEDADRLAARAEVLPERFDVGSAGEPPGHADDRDRFVVAVTVTVAGADVARGARGHRRSFDRRAQRARERSRRRCGEQRRRRDVAEARGMQPAQQPKHIQRTAAELEESVESADAVEAQHLRKGRADEQLALAARRSIRFRQRRSRRGGCGQGGTIELAVGRDGQGVQENERSRHHEVGQDPAQRATQPGHGKLAA